MTRVAIKEGASVKLVVRPTGTPRARVTGVVTRTWTNTYVSEDDSRRECADVLWNDGATSGIAAYCLEEL